jgi:transcriptional regulator CtsR
MTLNEVVQIIENKISEPISPKILIKLFQDGVITVNKSVISNNKKFKFGFR